MYGEDAAAAAVSIVILYDSMECWVASSAIGNLLMTRMDPAQRCYCIDYVMNVQ